MTLLAIRYRAWETLLIGFLMDFVWLPSGSALHSFPYFMIGSIVLVWIFEPLRVRFSY
jgi:hypothetical protein